MSEDILTYYDLFLNVVKPVMDYDLRLNVHKEYAIDTEYDLDALIAKAITEGEQYDLALSISKAVYLLTNYDLDLSIGKAVTLITDYDLRNRVAKEISIQKDYDNALEIAKGRLYDLSLSLNKAIGFDREYDLELGVQKLGLFRWDGSNWIEIPLGGGTGGGVDNFLDLTDTPDLYTDEGGKAVVVNVTEDALEFVQLVKVDQTDPQTIVNGNLSVDDPIDPSHIATKRYIDEQIANLHLDYYLDDTADGLGGLYLVMADSLLGAGTATSASLSAGTTNWKNWITPSGEPALTEILKGNWEMHFHALASSTSGRTAKLYFELYTRTTGGVETLQATSGTTGNLTTVNTPYEVYFHITDDVAIDATDRFVIKAYAIITGTAHTVSIPLGSSTNNSHISVDVPSTVLGNFEEVANKEVGSTLTDSTTKYPSSATVIDVLTALKLDDLATPDDNTDLDASTSKHGLLPKLPNDANKFLSGLGTWRTIGIYFLASILSNLSAPTVETTTYEIELNTNILSNLSNTITIT